MRWAHPGCLGLLVGCWTPDNYVYRLAADDCSRLYECDKSSFDSHYSSMDDCRAEFVEAWKPVQDCLNSYECDFDASQARACHRTYMSVSCSEWSSGDFSGDCEFKKIFNCTSDTDYLKCLLEVGS